MLDTIVEFPKDLNIDLTEIGKSLSNQNGISTFKKDNEYFIFYEDRLVYKGFKNGVVLAYENNKALKNIANYYGKELIPILNSFIANYNDVSFCGLDLKNERTSDFKDSIKICIMINEKPYFILSKPK